MPAHIMSSNNFFSRAAHAVEEGFKRFFIRLYVAIDKSQRKKADELIQRYSYLMCDPVRTQEHRTQLPENESPTSLGDRAPPNPKKARLP
jgi:tRNA G26 N,N-dimethylase Trm1